MARWVEGRAEIVSLKANSEVISWSVAMVECACSDPTMGGVG